MTQSTPKKRCWVMPVLAVSLAANLLIIGMAAGTIWRFKEFRPNSAMGATGRVALVRALDKEDRRVMFEQLRATRETSRNKHKAQNDDLLSALRANPFAISAVREILELQREQGAASRQSMEAKWTEIVSEMSQAERSAYADRLQRAFERGPRKGPKRQGD